MCVVSMVMDHYKPMFPDPNAQQQIPGPWTITTTQSPSGWLVVTQTEVDALRKLCAEFREALEAAKKVDKLTAQPDCADPEKAKLEERVALLEWRLNAITNAVKQTTFDK